MGLLRSRQNWFNEMPLHKRMGEVYRNTSFVSGVVNDGYQVPWEGGTPESAGHALYWDGITAPAAGVTTGLVARYRGVYSISCEAHTHSANATAAHQATLRRSSDGLVLTTWFHGAQAAGGSFHLNPGPIYLDAGEKIYLILQDPVGTAYKHLSGPWMRGFLLGARP